MDQKQEDIFRRIESALDQWAAAVPHAGAGQTQAAPAIDDLTRNVQTAWEAIRDLLGHVAQWEESATRLQECVNAVRDLQSWGTGFEQRLTSQITDLRQDLAQLQAITADLSHLHPLAEESFHELEVQPAPPTSAHVDADSTGIPIASVKAPGGPAPDASAEAPAGVTLDVLAAPASVADGPRRRIGDILVGAGVIAQEQLEEVLAEQRTMQHKHLGSLLVEMGLATEDLIAKTLASQLQVPAVRFDAGTVDHAAALLISGRLAARHVCIPIRTVGEHVMVAMENPLDLIAIEDVERATGLAVAPVVATRSDITDAIQAHYGPEAAF